MHMRDLYLVILCISIVSCIPLSQFYPYGQANGDQRVPTNDDGSSPKVEISTSFPYFNQLFHSLYVNTNGAISFSQTLSTYTPSSFPLGSNKKIVAPYWCDIDTRKGGDIWYYETNNQALLRNASQDVRDIFPGQKNFEAAWVFVATWDNVAFYGASTIGRNKRNTFQCLLITNGRHSFAIYLYNKITWTTGTASNGNDDTGLGGTPAQVGFDAGDGHNFLAINESRTARVINVTRLSNIEVPGKFVFRLDTETVTGGGCTQETGGSLTIFPRYITMFGGTELSIGGPCVEEGDKIEIEFEGVSNRQPCRRVSKTIVKCFSPMANVTGDVKVTLYLQRSNQDVPTSPTAPLNFQSQPDSIIYTGLSTFVNPVDTRKSYIYQSNPEMWAIYQYVTIGWNNLPFSADYVRIQQFSVGKVVGTGVKLIPEEYIARNISTLNHMYTFMLQTSRQAVVYRIHPEPLPTDYVDNFLLLPSVWSDVYIPRSANDRMGLRQYCNNWMREDSMYGAVSQDDVETCPCNINQARLDIARFSADPLCNTDNNGNGRNKCTFSPDAVQCVRMVFLGQIGNDNQCCYDKDGNLVNTNRFKYGGFAHRYHYKGGPNGNVPHLSNIYDDIVPYVYCCQYYRQFQNNNGLCVEFLQRRPASRCKGYVPPRIASTSGDPHMVTLDGLHYTFNGVGEFVLVTSVDKELNIQARMEQFKDEQGNEMQASVITSLAMQCNSTEAFIEIRLNEIRLVDVLANGELVDFADTNSVAEKGTTIVSSRGNNNTDLIWTTVTCRFPSIAINVTAVKKMMNFNLMIAGQDLRGSLRGLLGNFNGRTDDDFTSRNGVMTPVNASLSIIHHNFGISWMTNASESLFTYPVGKSHQSYQKKNFEPVFNPTDHCTMNVTDVCGDDQACSFDLCTTNDASFAAMTKQASEEMNILSQLTLPSCGVLTDVPRGSWNYSGYSASLECDPGYSPDGTSTVECGEDGKWTIVNATCEENQLVDCGLLPDVLFGIWYYRNRSAVLECRDGFSPNGTTTVQCNDYGEWSSTNTICEAEGEIVSSCNILRLSYQLLLLLFVVPALQSAFW